MLQLHPKTFSNVNIYFTIGRLMTLFKLVDFISSRRSSFIVNNTILRAYPTLLYMVWTILIVATIMASVIFVIERGHYTVNDDYPNGAYLRPNILNSGKEESPFSSVLIGMYFVVVTMTSTGYGDLVCTSGLGRALSNILMCSAIFILALPIAVLGNILSEEVDKYAKRKSDRETAIMKQLKRARQFPIYKYRRAGPSFVGAKQAVGETMRRLSSITINSYIQTPRNQPKAGSRRSHKFSSINNNNHNNGSNINNNNNYNNNYNDSNNHNLNELPTGLPTLNSQLSRGSVTGKPQRRGSDSLFERRISNATLEKMRRLSLNNPVQFVDASTTNHPFQNPTTGEYNNNNHNNNNNIKNNNYNSINDYNDGSNDSIENGITLNPINSSRPSLNNIADRYSHKLGPDVDEHLPQPEFRKSSSISKLFPQ